MYRSKSIDHAIFSVLPIGLFPRKEFQQNPKYVPQMNEMTKPSRPDLPKIREVRRLICRWVEWLHEKSSINISFVYLFLQLCGQWESHEYVNMYHLRDKVFIYWKCDEIDMEWLWLIDSSENFCDWHFLLKKCRKFPKICHGQCIRKLGKILLQVATYLVRKKQHNFSPNSEM